MKRLLLILLIILTLPTAVLAAPDPGYCKINGDMASYWLFDFENSQSLCNLLKSFFGLNTEWFGFNAFSATSIQDNDDFCDGWAGECEAKEITKGSSGGSSNSRRMIAYPISEEDYYDDYDAPIDPKKVEQMQKILDNMVKQKNQGVGEVAEEKGFFASIWEAIKNFFISLFS